jgi:hypothetical protein
MWGKAPPPKGEKAAGPARSYAPMLTSLDQMGMPRRVEKSLVTDFFEKNQDTQEFRQPISRHVPPLRSK